MKGILVTPELLRAYASGRKTLTRRLDKLKKINLEPDRWKFVAKDATGVCLFERDDGKREIVKLPYHVGEVVYLKETWVADEDNIVYKSDIGAEDTKTFIFSGYHWRSPLFMPAWAARHFQRIVSVRPERLQEITPADCVSEGIVEEIGDGLHLQDKFATLWDSLYSSYPWAMNPFCWRIESERAERP